MQYWRKSKSLWSPSKMLQVAPAIQGRQQPRHPEATRNDISWHLAADCESQQSPDLCQSKPFKSAERQHPTRVSGLQRKGVKRNPCELSAWEKTPLPGRHGVRECRLCQPLRLSHLCLCGRAAVRRFANGKWPPLSNKRSELACRYIVAVTWRRLQITEAGGSEGNSGHFQARGQEIDFGSPHSNHDRPLKPHFHHAGTPWLRSVFKEIPHVWRQNKYRLNPTLVRKSLFN